MKVIVNNEELREKISYAVNLLGDTVKTTLGPKGSNVIIDHSTLSPFITNDGVTIALNIESEDVVVNTILTLAKEASIKTNEVVGDGTTTTLVLLQSIYNSGLKYIKEGINPLLIKKELNDSLKEIIMQIKEKKRKPSKIEIINLASISANDREIGKILGEVLAKVKDSSAIKIIEDNIDETKINYLKGYTFDTLMASPYFFLDKKEITLKDVFVILFNMILDDIEDISIFINEIIDKNKKLVIIAKDYSELFINQILSLNLNNDLEIYLLKNPLYGNDELIFLEDLKAITNSKIVDNFSNITKNDLGYTDYIKIDKDRVNIQFKGNDLVKKRIKNIEKSIKEKKVGEEKSVINRLNMFKSGLVEIIVGANTITERREVKMRFDDALCAIRSLDNGIIPGSGLVFLEIADQIKADNYAKKILKEALSRPFELILSNANLDYKVVKDEIRKHNYTKIYNINNNVYEDIYNTEVIDSTNVLISSLTNAISIASMLLTTTSLVINEYSLNKEVISNFNEM